MRNHLFVCLLAVFFFCCALIFYCSLIADHSESIFKTTTKSIMQRSIISHKAFELFFAPLVKIANHEIDRLPVCVYFCEGKNWNDYNALFWHYIASSKTESEWTIERNETIQRPSPIEGETDEWFELFCVLYSSSCRVYFAWSYLTKSLNNRHFEIKIRSCVS